MGIGKVSKGNKVGLPNPEVLQDISKGSQRSGENTTQEKRWKTIEGFAFRFLKTQFLELQQMQSKR